MLIPVVLLDKIPAKARGLPALVQLLELWQKEAEALVLGPAPGSAGPLQKLRDTHPEEV